MSEQSPEIILHTQSRARLVINGLAKLLCHGSAGPETETDSISPMAPAPAEPIDPKISISEPIPASEKALAETAPSYSLLNSFLEPAYLQAKRELITSVIASDPDLSRFAAIREAKDCNASDGDEAYRAGNRAAEQASIAMLLALDAEAAAINPEIKDQFGDLEYQLYQIDRHKSLVVDATEEEAQALLGILKARAAVGDAKAPYANYKDTASNTKTVITTNMVTSYLRSKTFTNFICPADGGVIVDSRQPGSFEVPLTLITSAAGFDNWTGSNSYGVKSWQTQEGVIRKGSLEAIQYYASLPTELPPVREIAVKIDRDGSVHCDNGEGDSHRIAAAVLRGQATVRANRLEFLRVM